MQHTKFTVKGKVQGVWFRKHTLEKANELGLKGTVQNMDDGSVVAFAQGSAKALDAFSEWLWQGSPQSDVKEVLIEEQSTRGVYEGFEILRK